MSGDLGRPDDTARMSRPLTERERAVLDALLAPDFDGAEQLGHEARQAVVGGGCDCGCPSVGFYKQPGADGLFLYTVGDHLGGIAWFGNAEKGDLIEFPDPTVLVISPAS